MTLAGVAMQAQQHAPAIETCKADVALWDSREDRTEYMRAETVFLTDGVPNRTKISKLALTELIARLDEMNDCANMMPRDDRYHAVADFYHDVMMERYFRFVLRHQLRDQVIKEDAQGIR
jgi:hypothetical protein